jgi:hypothetical protein
MAQGMSTWENARQSRRQPSRLSIEEARKNAAKSRTVEAPACCRRGCRTPAAFRVRTFGCTSFVVDPPNGQIPPVTQAAAARRKAEVIISDEMIHDTRVIPLDGRLGARNRRQ